MVSQKSLRELFDYCPERGRLIRRISVGRELSGKVAGSDSSYGGHRAIRINYKNYSERQCVWIWHYGTSNVPLQIGTRNKDPLDNRIENLYAKSKKTLPSPKDSV